jgi:hypothetical protein
LRSRILRAAIGDVRQLRESAALAEERIAAVAAEFGEKLAAAEQRIAYLEHFSDDLDCMLTNVLRLVVESELSLRATTDSEQWAKLVDAIESAAAEACNDASIDTLEESAAEIIAGLDSGCAQECDVDWGAGPGRADVDAQMQESEARDE